MVDIAQQSSGGGTVGPAGPTGATGAAGAAGSSSGGLSGLTLSQATVTTLGIAAGLAADSTNAATITLSTAWTKALTAWVAGTGNGSLDTGAIATSTWYHVFAISKAAGASPDVLISLSATAPTMPSTYTLFRRLGSIKTDGSSQITAFTQFGNDFRWLVNVLDSNDTGGGVTANSVTLTVPTGVKVIANISLLLDNGSAVGMLITSLDDTDTAPDTTNQFNTFVTVNSIINTVAMSIRTNTSAQIRRRSTAATVTSFLIRTFGWTDYRGQG